MTPASLLIAMMIPGPWDGMTPSGRNWLLSVDRVEMYTDLVTSALFTKLGGSALAMSAALCVLIQCMVATSASTTFCTVAWLEFTQSVRASTPAVGVKPPSHFFTPAVVVRSNAG